MHVEKKWECIYIYICMNQSPLIHQPNKKYESKFYTKSSGFSAFERNFNLNLIWVEFVCVCVNNSFSVFGFIFVVFCLKLGVAF